MKDMMSKVKGFGVKGAIGVAVGVTLMSSYGYNEGGVYTRLQQPMIGHTWVKEEGFYPKMPFLSKTKEFNKNGTIASTDNSPLIEASGITVSPTIAQFADSYEMRFEWSMRYELPSTDDNLEFMYQKLKNEDNMLANTLMPFGQTMFTDSVNQMLGQDFAQGGKNALRTLVDNQTQNGMYQTKVVRTPVARDSGEGSNSVLGGASTDMLITEVKYLEDDAGKKLRTPLSIASYKLKIVANSFQIVENKAVGRLTAFMETKQKNQQLQLDQDEKQKILAKKAQTAQLQGEMDLITRTNELNIKKEEAIIAMEQQVAQAGLQAEKEVVEREKVASLAIIDKNTQLQEAEANQGIQRANYEASVYEAKAIKQVGFAEAAVKKADYQAIDKAILISNNNRDVAIAMYKSNINIDMPDYVNIGGEAANQTSVEQMSTLKMLEQLKLNTAK